MLTLLGECAYSKVQYSSSSVACSTTCFHRIEHGAAHSCSAAMRELRPARRVGSSAANGAARVAELGSAPSRSRGCAKVMGSPPRAVTSVIRYAEPRPIRSPHAALGRATKTDSAVRVAPSPVRVNPRVRSSADSRVRSTTVQPELLPLLRVLVAMENLCTGLSWLNGRRSNAAD